MMYIFDSRNPDCSVFSTVESIGQFGLDTFDSVVRRVTLNTVSVRPTMQIPEVEPGEEQYEKEVMFVFYTGVDVSVDKKEAMDMTCSDTDFYSQKMRELTRYRLKAPGIDKRIDEEEFEKLSGIDLGEASVVKNVEERQRDRYSPTTWRRKMLRPILNELPDIIEGVGELNSIGRRYEAGGRHTVDFTTSGPTEMGLLKHPDEISNDDIWKDKDDKQWVGQITVSIGPLPEENYEKASDVVIQGIIDQIDDLDWVERVRWTDCEERTVKEGVCYL